MTLQLIPFEPELLPQAGELLARRQRRDRAIFPELPARFEDKAVAQQAIEAALARKHAHGFAALENGRLLAYLIGDIVIDNVWGRAGWVRLAGCAYDPAAGVEPVRDLYAALGEQWVKYGVFFHFGLMTVADPDLIQAWFSLSFGLEQVHALIDLEALKPTLPATPPDIEIRRVGPADGPHLAALSDVIWRVQVKAPVWAVMMPETVAGTEASWADLVDEPEAIVWLALIDGKPVALQGYWPAETGSDQLHIPEQCVHLSVAGTHPAARGRGLNTLLTQYGLAQAQAAGYRFCEIDWRSANLLASRFWPKQGFRPVVYRLARRLDPRIAWATGVGGKSKWNSWNSEIDP
ncbi:MAG: GNAT family N-acetyltransferase [Anaerolineae bacterium]|nr:GNAT family N-acetyltransferase [Anaerolineae bacterium]